MKTRILFSIALMGFVNACTSAQLEYSTLAQGRTLTDLHYQIVLDNVAMFREAPGSLPWHVKITDGSITISDSVTPDFSYISPPILRSFGLSGSRGWQGNWNVVPVLVKEDLAALKKLYENLAKEPWIEDGAVPSGFVWGRYGARFVWVRKENLHKLTEETLNVLSLIPKEPEFRFQRPGPVLVPGR